MRTISYEEDLIAFYLNVNIHFYLNVIPSPYGILPIYML